MEKIKLFESKEIEPLKEGRMGVETEFLHDWTLDNGTKVTKGDKVTIDLIDDDPNTNFVLIPVRIDGKFIGYAEAENPRKMFKLTESKEQVSGKYTHVTGMEKLKKDGHEVNTKVKDGETGRWEFRDKSNNTVAYLTAFGKLYLI